MGAGFLERLNSGYLLFDGAMGTVLQKKGLGAGELPELLNITHPELIAEVHREYVRAGCDVVSTNTFGANRLKMKEKGYDAAEIIGTAVALAKSAGAAFTALDIGPSGQLLEPMGTLSFDGAYDLFAEQVKAGARAGADLILLETFSDLYEIKAALLAAKEHCDLPVIALMTFQEDARTFMGTDARCAALTLTGLGADAVGINCSLGPRELMPVVDVMLEYAGVPVMIQPNAGLPVEVDGDTVYGVQPEEFARFAATMLQKGARILGGCCGTTPAYTALLRREIDRAAFFKIEPARHTAVCSATRAAVLDGGVTVIGERINPTGKKRLKEALRQGDMDYIVGEAIDQTEAGADILDVNTGLPELDEPAVLCRVIREIQSVTRLPLQIDSVDPVTIERAARIYNGRPLINSVSGKRESMDAVFPIAKKYGAVLIGLTLDDSGIPETAEGRLAVAKKLLREAERYGIPKESLIIDCLTLTVSAQQEQVMETLKAVRLVKEKLGLKTALGVSNVSFGLPARPVVTSVFLAAALGAGLDAPIVNPMSDDIRRVLDAFRVLNAQDKDAEKFIAAYASETEKPRAAEPGERSLYDIVLQGRREESAAATEELLKKKTPAEIIDGEFIPALNEVGRRFEAGELFLPQLMQSAGAVKNAFEVIKAASKGESGVSRGDIVLATVKGDIHDIGKNIVKMMLENYGYRVIDLGRDVPPETVVETVLARGARLVGLSALMTTTVKSMQETIEALRAAGADCKIFVGGAVLSEEYAAMVGADYYAGDAQAGVRIANEFFGV